MVTTNSVFVQSNVRGRPKGKGRGPFLQWCHFLPVPLQLLAEQQQREEAEEEAKKSQSKPDEERYEEEENADDDGIGVTVGLSPSISDKKKNKKKPSSTESTTTGNDKSSNSNSISNNHNKAAAGSVDSSNPKLKRHAGASGRNSFRSSRSSSHRRGR